jgi:formylglycine-generating enzyme required for sulfatase activity
MVTEIMVQKVNSTVGSLQTKYRSGRFPALKQYVGSFIRIKSGHVDYGNDRVPFESPAGRIRIAEFSCNRHPVSVRLWREFSKSELRPMPDPPSWGWQEFDPIVNVSLADVLQFTDWVYKASGIETRLPSEFEWEYIAKFGLTTNPDQYWQDMYVKHLGVNVLDPDVPTLRVNRTMNLMSSSSGVSDLFGNVLQWTLSIRRKYDHIDPRIIVPKKHQIGYWHYIVRGSSWRDRQRDDLDAVRCSRRQAFSFDTRDLEVGFRLCK